MLSIISPVRNWRRAIEPIGLAEAERYRNAESPRAMALVVTSAAVRALPSQTGREITQKYSRSLAACDIKNETKRAAQQMVAEIMRR